MKNKLSKLILIGIICVGVIGTITVTNTEDPGGLGVNTKTIYVNV